LSKVLINFQAELLPFLPLELPQQRLLVLAQLRRGMELKRLQIQFRIITCSACEATKMLNALHQISQTSVFDFKVLAEAAAM
jgi:hypothetical protein